MTRNIMPFFFWKNLMTVVASRQIVAQNLMTVVACRQIVAQDLKAVVASRQLVAQDLKEVVAWQATTNCCICTCLLYTSPSPRD